LKVFEKWHLNGLSDSPFSQLSESENIFWKFCFLKELGASKVLDQITVAKEDLIAQSNGWYH